MSLTYDPSAIRYATTQEAYGCTWTLNKVESDGAQIWKNAKGQEALVPKCAIPVPNPEPTLEIKFDSTENLTVNREVSSYFPISNEIREQWVNGTWENLGPNSYNDERQIDRYLLNGKPYQLERVLGTPEKPAPDPRRSRTIQSIGVDVSNSPPRTALVVAEKMINGAIMVHDEVIVDKALTNDEIQELVKNLLNRAGAQSGRVSVDRPNESNSKRVPRRHEIGDQKLSADGTTLTWDGLKWRNSVTGKWYPEAGGRVVDSRGTNPRKFDGEKWVRDS